MAKYEDKLLDHDYDGIQELDNDLPRWWVWLFYGAIIWAFFYMMYFHVLDIGYSSRDQYLKEMDPNYVRADKSSDTYFGILPKYRSPYDDSRFASLIKTQTKGSGGMTGFSRDADTLTYIALTDKADIAKGREVFVSHCASCHGKAGEGLIGPNFTDDYWLHGAGMTNVVKSIKYGYPTKGMVSWLGTLKTDQIMQVASYVLTLRGTNPPNQKPPQGELVEE